MLKRVLAALETTRTRKKQLESSFCEIIRSADAQIDGSLQVGNSIPFQPSDWLSLCFYGKCLFSSCAFRQSSLRCFVLFLYQLVIARREKLAPSVSLSLKLIDAVCLSVLLVLNKTDSALRL